MTRARTALLVGLALVAYWVMAVSVSPRQGVTADEIVHLTGGYTYWKFNDYRLHPENGTLPMRLAALPLLAMDLRFPPLTDPNWLNSQVNRIGEDFFFHCGNPTDAMLWRARAMIALLGVFTVWLTWRWARGLFGATAGWIALALVVFSPTLLAHGGLATSDMALTAAMLAALSLIWQLLHRATWTRLVLTTFACAAVFLSKMSGVLVVPLAGLLLVLRWLHPAPLILAFGRHERWLRRRRSIVLATLTFACVAGLASLVLLWGAYGFRYEGFNRTRSDATSYYFSWDIILDHEPLPTYQDSELARFGVEGMPPRPTLMTHTVEFLREHHVLPEAYLWGFAHTYKFSRERPAFFLGEYGRTGWPAFFPVAFVMKTTLSALVLIAAGFAALVWARRHRPRATDVRWRRDWLYRAAPLVLFFVVYWAMAINMHLNIGHRHILPTYPIFFVFASAAALWLVTARRRALAWALAAVLALHAVDSLAARPFYLAYFQPLAGGPDRAYRYFVDSSLDWGQGLPDLARWLDQQKRRGPPEPVYLTYFGADSPRARGLPVIRFGDELNDRGARNFPAPIRGGWFAISATYFQRIYIPVRGRWTRGHEALYRSLMQRLNHAPPPAQRDAAQNARLLREAMDYEVLQFGRLAHYLRDRRPDTVIGASILVFHLTDAEVAFALYAPWEQFQPYVE